MPRAAQLVYTNVEQERSPHRRRGVQVWLWTESLPAPVREEVEQRVNTFARPGAEPFVRRIFAPLAAGPFVMLAEAVPLTKPDKFGRGGRFHTHALLFDRDDFLTAGGDPFALFDSGFAFQRDPDDVPDDVWKQIHLPEVELTPVPPHAPTVQPAFAPVVPELLAWLLPGDPAGTVALPISVADADAVLRAVMRLLPPTGRLRLSFDTLWTGKGKHVPRVCGAGSPAMLQAWTYRQFVRFDLSRKTIQPPLPVSAAWAKPLAGWWATTPDLTDEDRRSAAALAEWVSGTDSLPPVATPRAAEWAGTLSETSERWEQAKRAAVDRTFPESVRRLPGVEAKAAEYFGDWGADALERVRGEVPKVVAAEWLGEVVFEGRPLDVPTARAVSGWCGNDQTHAVQKLALALTRWIPEFVDFACQELRRPSPGREWFRDFCFRTLPPERQQPAAASGLVAALLQNHTSLEEAEVFEAVHTGRGADEVTLDPLRLLLRVHDRCGSDPDRFLAERPELCAWADEHLLPACVGGADWVAFGIDGAAADDWSHLFRGATRPLALLGLRVKVPGTGWAALLNFFLRRHGYDLLRRLSPHLDASRFPRDGDAPGGDERAWRECGKLYQMRDADALTDRLREADNVTYRRLANDYLFTHAAGQLSFGVLPDGESFFVGAAVSEFHPDQFDRTEPLLRALAGTAVPEVRIDLDVLPVPEERFLNRFGWLVVRLLTGIHSNALGIPPG